MKNIVLIAGLFDDSSGIAVVNRYRALAKSLVHAGVSPVFVSNLKKTNSENHVSYLPLPKFFSGWLGARLQSRFFEWALKHAVQSLDREKIAAIIIPRNLATFRLLLANYLWLHLPIIVDCMEWHEHWQFKYGRLSPNYWRFLWSFHFVVPRAHGVLAISNFLAKYFSSRGSPVLRVPPQIDSSEFLDHKVDLRDQQLQLFYAGTPYKKDNLALLFQAFSKLTSDQRSRIRFTVAGTDLAELKKLAAETAVDFVSIEPLLHVLGRISREQVLEKLAGMDFIILLRNSSRYSEAGFPSKVSESLAAGTPVIANLTSDLGDTLVSGENSIIVNNLDVDGVVGALRQALALDKARIGLMSCHAKATAKKYFDFRVHGSELKDFILRLNG